MVVALQVGLLWLAGLVAAGQFAKIAVPFAAVGAVYPSAGAWLGLMLTIISVTGAALGLVAGRLAAQLGPRRLVVAGLALAAVLSAVQAVFPPLAVMLPLRVLEGLSHLAIVVAAPTLIAGLASDAWRAAALTLWSTFFGVAFALTAAIAPSVLAAGGLGAIFLGHAGLAAVLTLAVALAVPGAPGAQAAQGGRTGAAAIYGDPAKSAPALGWLAYTLAFVSLLTLLPASLAEPAGTALAATMPLATLVVSLTLGVVVLRWAPSVAVLVAGFALALVAAPALAPEATRSAAAILAFAAFGLVQAGTFAAVAELNPSAADRAAANGAVAQTGNLGNLFGTPILIALTGAVGPAAYGGFLAVCCAVGIAAHLRLAGRRRGRAFALY